MRKFLGILSKLALAQEPWMSFHTPIQMKKNRPGVLLTVLCAQDQADKFTELIFRQTTSFVCDGTQAERRKLRREMAEVQTAYGKVAIKIGRLDGRIVQAAPEFESCKAIAAAADIPIKTVYEAAVKALFDGCLIQSYSSCCAVRKRTSHCTWLTLPCLSDSPKSPLRNTLHTRRPQDFRTASRWTGPRRWPASLPHSQANPSVC
jgi:hypothetical protein